MQMTELKIAPTHLYQERGPKNPMRAVVKLADDKSTVECVLSDEAMRKLLDLVAEEVALNAERNVREFVAAVTAIDTEKSTAMIGAPAA